jgi:hypothetical protein
VRERDRNRRPAARSAKPPANLTADEVDYWLAEFQAESVESEADGAASKSRPRHDDGDNVYNPFPPGYGEDLEA